VWVSAPQSHSRVSNINFDIWILLCGVGSLLISHEKYIKDGKVLAHLRCQSNILPGSLTDLSAWLGFHTSSPQQGVKYQLWYAVKYHALGYSLLYILQCHSRNFRTDGSFMKTSIKDSNTTTCNQIWVPNNPYICTSNYHCLYLSIY
jgi:hypothetical protein